MPNRARVVGAQDTLMICYQIEWNGRVLEGSLDGPAQSYQMGVGQWPAQLETAILGSQLGRELQVEINARDDVFGKFDPERVLRMHQTDFKQSPAVGELIEFTLPNGQQTEGQVLSVFNDNIEIDFNHPYIGRDLVVKIRIDTIGKA